jgi:signal transduction histidine kinase
LRGYAQLITRDISEQGASDPSRLSRALTRIDEQSGKLARLVAQLLDISRIDSGKLALERRPTDVAQLARGVAATIQAQSTDHLLKVRNTSPLLASIDPLRFEQVLVNLVGNAVKYSPNGGEINIDVSAVGTSSVVVAVRDHGIGIPHERRMHIFDRFYQAHGEGHFGGMGLGLYISRQIVEMHGARIEAEFPADGGTCFVVSLPAAAAVQDKAPRLRSDLGAVLAAPAQRRPAAAQLVGVA